MTRALLAIPEHVANTQLDLLDGAAWWCALLLE